MDQLSDGGANLELLDKVGADGIVILSTADGTPAHQTTERWGRIEVTPLGDSMRTLMIRDTLERYRKSLPEEDARKLASAPQSGSPLFLSLALEELRVDAHHETLSTLVDDILKAPDAQTLTDVPIHHNLQACRVRICHGIG